MKTCLFYAIVAILVLAGGLLIVNDAVSRGERAECEKWTEQSKTYPIWWSSGWQKSQCRAYGIELQK